jgi:hypothetical protein
MMVALAVIGVLSLLSFTSTQPAEASIQEIDRISSARVDLAKLTEPLQTPLQQNATAVVTSAGVVNNPLKPGVAATFTFRFTTSGAGALAVGDDIILGWPKEYLVPETIDRSQVSIATADTGSTIVDCVTGDTVVPTEVSVDFVGPDRDPEIRLRVPDMSTSDVCPGNQGIDNSASVTIIFRQSAGIRNAEEADDGYEVTVITTADADDAVFSVPVPWFVELSSPDGGRGSSLTLVGLGFKDGNTVTFWRDANADGVRQGTEAGPTGLCQAESNSSFVATCTFTMNNPPFKPGFFQTGGTCTLPTPVNCNFINAVDSRQNTVDLDLFPSPQARLNLQTYELRGSITASPNSGKPGDTLTIQLRDFPDSAITSFNLSGTAITPTASMTPVNGSANFSIEIPTGTAQGNLELQIANATSGTRRTSILVGGANLSLSHETVLPNQDLTISGDGFTQSSAEVCIAEGGITLADVPLQIDDTNDCGAATLAAADVDPATLAQPERGIRLSSGGTFTVTVRVEETTGTIPVALATAGTFELKVVDTQGAQGILTVTVPERTIEVSPLSARPRDLITVIGRNFIADNPDGLSTNVQLTYDGGASCTRSTTADPDASGNFRETLRIPTGCAIPSTNTVRAELQAANTTIDTETATHEIPQALVRVSPVRGSSGNTVTVSGEGFRTFTAVDDVRFGNLSGLGNRTVNTDASGNFSVEDLVVPGLDVGIHAVRVDVGTASDPNRVTATTSYEVVEGSGIGASATTPIQDALAPLFEGETLDRVFFFNNDTKSWSFFIEDEAFSSANDLDDVASGLPIWIRVTEDTSAELNGQAFDLTCVNPGTAEEDCWNLIVFP